MSQNELLLRHFAEHKSITAKEAFMLYGILRLSARIKELRDLGFIITSIPERSKNKYGVEVRYARYFLEAA